jgi:hypothetical protein
MRQYRKKQKQKPARELALEDVDPWKELEALLGHPVVVCNKGRHPHVHLTPEDIARVESNTEHGRKVRL